MTDLHDVLQPYVDQGAVPGMVGLVARGDRVAVTTVVRTPASPIDDVVPAARSITVFDLLSFTAGYGFPSDFHAAGGAAPVRRAEGRP